VPPPEMDQEAFQDYYPDEQNSKHIPCGGGYHEQYYDGLLDEAIRKIQTHAGLLKDIIQSIPESTRPLGRCNRPQRPFHVCPTATGKCI